MRSELSKKPKVRCRAIQGKCRHLSADQIEQYRADHRKPTIRFRVAENRRYLLYRSDS